MGAKQSSQYPIDHSPSLVASNKESRGELRKKSSARNIAPSSVSTSPETLTRDIPLKLGGGKGNMSTTTTPVLKEPVGLKSDTEAKKNFLQDTTGTVKSTVREFPIPGGKKRGFEMESPEETTNSRTPRNESQLPPGATPEFDNLGVGIKQNISDGDKFSPQTPSIKSRDLTDIFDKSVVMGDSNQRNGQIKNVGPPKDTSRLKGEEKNVLISSTGKPAKSQKPPTSIASKKITAGSDLTSLKKAGPIINLPTPAPTAKKSEPKEETTVFTQITGKKKTRKLPNLGDFAKQKPVDLIDEGLDDTTPGEDLTKEDLTELEKAEKLLEESYASGKTKKILPEKEGETVRQELIIEGDEPGETKKIIQEITKRRISNPGKLPKELLAQMDKKDGIYTI